MHVSHNEPNFPARANLPAYNVGGGAVGLLTNKVGLRFDLRFLRTLPPGEEQGPFQETRGPSSRARALLDGNRGRGVQVLKKGTVPFCEDVGFRKKGYCPFSLGRDLQAGFPIAGGIDAAVQNGSLDDDHRRS